jgi:EAL domain-containing protein (putative c-di-GMP-specific phosphodiesterase class I)
MRVDIDDSPNAIACRHVRACAERPGRVNLPAAGWLATRRHVPGLRRGLRNIGFSMIASYVRRPGLIILTIGFAVTVVAATLEAINPHNYWILFEDLSCVVAPTTAALAVAMAAERGGREHRNFRWALALSLSLTAAGQATASIPDLIGRSIGALGAISDVCYVVGASLGVAALMVTLYRHLEREARRTIMLDGLVIAASAMTFVFANWLHQSFLPGSQVGVLFAEPAANLLVPLVSALFFASAAAAVVAALSLRLEPSRRGAWAVTLGIIMLALAWQGWIGRFLSGAPDGIEPMDFIFPFGALATAYGGVTWSLTSGGGPRYERVARATSDWLPIVAILGCAILDVMPRSRPLAVDPIAVGTCVVVLLAVIRQRILQSRERVASERLTTEMSERAATTVSLARLEAAPTIEGTAARICDEALRIDGIDGVVLFAFSPVGVVPIAHSGPMCRPVVVGEAVPPDRGNEILEHAEFGLWLESWSSRVARDEYDAATKASGLLAEALAPLIWNDEAIGVLSMGATSPAHARRLGDRLATLTEFSVMSAAVLGPMLSERWQRDITRAQVRTVIANQAFTPVFQPIVDLQTRRFVGYEALTRFSDGTRPDLRFLAADKVGMMTELETACLNVQIEQASYLPEGSFVSLNVSPALAMCLTPLLEVLSAADRPVVLEITEHAEIEDYSQLLSALDQVRPFAKLAVDDAGAGYAGLHHILELRPQWVKLDISLVRNIDTDPARQAMVTGMTRFAESVGCDLIAEGIETENELTVLKLLKVGFGQGYYLARPESIDTIMAAKSPGQAPATPLKTKRRREAA